MAVNPMQRKANNSFLLGVVLTLLITGAIIAFLLFQMSNLKKEQQAKEQQFTYAYVLNRDIKSGEIITEEDLTTKETISTVIPYNAIKSSADFSSYSLCDSEGRNIIQEEPGKMLLALAADRKVELILDEETGRYYYEEGTQKKYITLSNKTVIAKVDLTANTLLTDTVITKGELLADDIRKQEYNVITLPTQIENGEYVDIRFRLPNGEDYIILSHKQITIPQIEGSDSTSSIWMNLDELETLTMSGAIVEAYRMDGGKLYATRYVEPGMQEAAIPTYIPSNDVIKLIQADSNVVLEAKNALYSRMREVVQLSGEQPTTSTVIRTPIEKAKNIKEAEDNLKAKVNQEIKSLQTEREKYIQSLGGSY